MDNRAPSHPPLSKPAQPLIPALDGFRAIAIIIVMLSHVGLSHVVPGQFGVTLFFFLSGYLIVTLLRREFDRRGYISLKAFYLRRAVRILPPMYFAIAFAIALSASGLIRPLNYPGLVTDVFFLSNYLPLSSVPIGLWSLAVEEHFYLVFPMLALLIFRAWGARACALACSVICVLTLGIRVFEVSRLHDFTQVNFWTHTRIDSILYGAILACWNNPVIDEEDHLPGKWLSYALGGGLLLASFAVRDEAFRQTLRYTVQGIGLLLIFNAAIRDASFARVFLDSAPMRMVALLSYTLYLVHAILVAAAERWYSSVGALPAATAAIALSFAIAWGVHVAVERPLAHWRRGVERKWRAMREQRQAAEPDRVAPSSQLPAIDHP